MTTKLSYSQKLKRARLVKSFCASLDDSPCLVSDLADGDFPPQLDSWFNELAVEQLQQPPVMGDHNE